MAASSSSSAATFTQTTLEFFDFIVNIIEDLYDAKHIGVSSAELQTPRILIANYDSEDLIGFFLDCHNDWHYIAAKNDLFILDVMPQAYIKIPFDVTLLTIPLRYFREWKPTGAQPERLVEEEDIATLWEYFRSMIHTAVSYVLTRRRESDPGFRPEIDVAAVVRSFGFKDLPC